MKKDSVLTHMKGEPHKLAMKVVETVKDLLEDDLHVLE